MPIFWFVKIQWAWHGSFGVGKPRSCCSCTPAGGTGQYRRLTQTTFSNWRFQRTEETEESMETFSSIIQSKMIPIHDWGQSVMTSLTIDGFQAPLWVCSFFASCDFSPQVMQGENRGRENRGRLAHVHWVHCVLDRQCTVHCMWLPYVAISMINFSRPKSIWAFRKRDETAVSPFTWTSKSLRHPKLVKLFQVTLYSLHTSTYNT